MQGGRFELPKALSHWVLNPAPLTAWVPLRIFDSYQLFYNKGLLIRYYEKIVNFPGFIDYTCYNPERPSNNQL